METTVKVSELQEALQKIQGILPKDNNTMPAHRLQESNRRKTKWICENATAENPMEGSIKQFRESFKRAYGIDPLDNKKLPVVNDDGTANGNFSWKKLYEKVSTTYREADSATTFVQFLRAGLQQIVNSMYQSVPTTYGEWAHTVNSTKSTELYAPNQGIGFPSEVGEQQKFTEVGVAALDLSLKNRKFGTIYPCSYELFNDDQTGTFAQQAGLLGEYLRLVAEVYCYGKLASVSGMTYATLNIPQSESQPSDESVYPWAPASTPFIGGGYNRPASYGLLSGTTLQAAFIGLMQQKNKKGLKLMTRPNRLLIGPAYAFDAPVLLNSSFFPSVVTTAGSVGGNFAINPLKGMADITLSRFMFKNDGTCNGDSKAWYLIDSNVPAFVLQLREGSFVEQEAPNSGRSFDQDIVRFKGRTRLNADFIDPRFMWQGNDGSVTS